MRAARLTAVAPWLLLVASNALAFAARLGGRTMLQGCSMAHVDGETFGFCCTGAGHKGCDWPAKCTDRPLHGITLEPYNPGPEPFCMSADQVAQHMANIAKLAGSVRTYAIAPCEDTMAAVVANAQRFNVKVMLGLAVSNNQGANEAEIGALQRIVSRYPGAISHIACGNEVMSQGKASVDVLVGMIRAAKAVAGGIPVGTTDVGAVWRDGPGRSVIGECDVGLLQSQPFYMGAAVSCPPGSPPWCIDPPTGAAMEYDEMKQLHPEKPWIVSETGWPSGGSWIGKAIPSPATANYYMNTYINEARARDIPFHYFSYKDATWKAYYDRNAPDYEFHFGVTDAYGSLKGVHYNCLGCAM